MRSYLLVIGALVLVLAALVACSREPASQVNGGRVEVVLVSDVPALAAEAEVTFDADLLGFVGIEPVGDSILSIAQEMRSGLVRLVLVTSSEEPVAGDLVRLSFEARAGDDHDLEVAWIVTDEDLLERPFTQDYRAEPVGAASELRTSSADDVKARALAVLPSSVPSDAVLDASFANYPLGDVDASGTVAGPDAVIITRIVNGVIDEPSDHQLYHADLNSSGTIDTFDVLVVMRKWLDDALEAQLQVAPRVVRPSPDTPALILVGNAGNEPLPTVRVAPSSDYGFSLEEITGADAVGQVYEVRTDWQGTTGVIAFDAGGAGAQAVSLNVRPIAPGEPPDPSRYFSVVVTDMLRNAVTHQSVSAGGLRLDDEVWLDFWGSTDEGGVAVLADFEESWYAEGEYRIHLDARIDWGTAPRVRRVLGTYDELTLPGSVSIDASDARYRDLLVSVADDMPSPSGRRVRIGPDLVAAGGPAWLYWGGSDSVWPSDQLRYRVDPGPYVLSFTYSPWDAETTSYYLRDSVTVLEDTEFVFDATSAPAFTLDVGFDLADEAASTDGWNSYFCAGFVEDGYYYGGRVCPNVASFATRSLRVTPGEYNVDAYFHHSVNNDSWDFAVLRDDNPQDLTPAGGEATWAYGGAPTLSIAGLDDAYQPGAEVLFHGVLVDGFGNLIWDVWHSKYDADAQEWSYPETVYVEVTDPNGVVVLDESGWGYYLYSDVRYELLTDAPEGTYVVEYRVDTGPYADMLIATSTFDVAETGAADLDAGGEHHVDEHDSAQLQDIVQDDIERTETMLRSYVPDPDDPASASIERWQQRVMARTSDGER